MVFRNDPRIQSVQMKIISILLPQHCLKSTAEELGMPASRLSSNNTQKGVLVHLGTLRISLLTVDSFTEERMPINDRCHSNYLGNESIEAVNELSLLTTLREIYRPGATVSQLSPG